MSRTVKAKPRIDYPILRRSAKAEKTAKAARQHAKRLLTREVVHGC